MQNVFIKFPFCFALEHDHLEKREGMDAQLDHEVGFKLVSRVQRPVGVLFVDLCARATSSDHGGEPVLIPKKHIGEDCNKCVENAIERQFECGSGFVYSFLSFILRVDERLNPISAKVEPRVFNNLYRSSHTKMPMKPTKVQTIESILITQ